MTRTWSRLPRGLAGSTITAPAAALVVALAATTAAAQGLATVQDSDEPLEISAEQGIEWRRDTQVYVASGNARVAQGELEVYADVLTAHYREGNQGDTEIYWIEANGNVRIVSPTETVYGDDGTYDVDKGHLVLTGNDLRLEAEDGHVMAHESLEYWEAENVAVARGDAVAIQEDKRVEADMLVAHFEPGAEGGLELSTVQAEGDVRISTPSEFASGRAGTYYARKQLATLSGDVKITQGKSQINGQYAEFNLETGVSRLLAAPPGQSAAGPVRGLLVPEEKLEQDQDGETEQRSTP
jgi:lipopolysaccharide export system protein LptA